MKDPCNHRNPLQRSGVNRYQRVFHALLPSHAKVDERDHADLILFAKNYASHLKYFNSNNQQDGDWTPFMSLDVSVTLASLAKLDVKGCFRYVKMILDEIKRIDVGSPAILQNQFKVLFDFGFSITTILDTIHKSLPGDVEFKKVLGNAIHSDLPQYYDRLKKYYDGAVALSIVDATSTFTVLPQPVGIIFSQNFDPARLDTIWVDVATPPFAPTFNGPTIAVKIRNTSTHNLFTGIFDNYLKTLASIAGTASAYLDQTLASFPRHEPHYGLYLTFIKLFKHAQEQLNDFGRQHLDLYYKLILSLNNKNAQPDRVHLTFELAKAVKDNYLLAKDTVFKAGKDADGLEIFYRLTNDLVLNRGAVKLLKSIFISRDMNRGTKQFFASTMANSEDGLGGKLLSPDKSWKAFGDNTRLPGEIGWVVASNYLYLTQGIRTIIFSFYAPPGEPISFSDTDIRDIFTVQLSAEKGWHNALVDPGKVTVHPSKEYFTITVNLDGGDPSIVPYTQALHKYNYNTSLPVARFLLKEGKAANAVWDFAIGKIGISVKVEGMKDLLIENDTGILDATKPFELFGAIPRAGSSFIIGCRELFLKTLQPAGTVETKLYIQWDNVNELRDRVETSARHTVDILYLEDATWKAMRTNVELFAVTPSVFDTAAGEFPTAAVFNAIQPGESNIAANTLQPLEVSNPFLARDIIIGNIAEDVIGRFGGRFRNGVSLSVSLPALDVTPERITNENYSNRSTCGFLKLELNDPDFGHGDYAERLAEAAKVARITTTSASGTSTTTVEIDEVIAPYTPTVKEIILDYSAGTVIDFELPEEGAFIHFTTLGSKEAAQRGVRTLLPALDHEGELFVGIENFKTDQTLSILFQVAEGTADPLAVKQEVDWYFLGKDNEWIPFRKEHIVDGTNDLTLSGIVKFSISDLALIENTVLTDQLHWLRAAVREKTQAVCKIIDVVAQAASAQFYDPKNSGNVFKNILGAGTISKAVVSDASIKKISQPYSSFGGRVKERDEHFYTRVSERLRHKTRAISIWDYERLVLEAFPSIFKVKCINHSTIIERTEGSQSVYVDNELKPGHVLVVPIPDLQNQNAFDPLRPYTSIGLMAEIRKFLYQYTSPHVNLDVRNPRFEEIQLEFKVKYKTEDNDFYTTRLKEEIETFLAPWAFDPKTDMEFGGKVSKSVLINFIEERAYVDFLSCIKMFVIVDGIKSDDTDEAQPTSSRSVFVSVKSDDVLNGHKVSFITDTCEC